MNRTNSGTRYPALLTIEQVCLFLNISRAEFYRLDTSGKFAPLSVGLCRKRLYIKSEIENWIQAGLPNREKWQQMNQKINERSISMKNEQNFEPLRNIIIQNSSVIFGTVNSENVQNGNHANIKNDGLEKGKKGLPRISEIVFTIFKRLLLLVVGDQ